MFRPEVTEEVTEERLGVIRDEEGAN